MKLKNSKDHLKKKDEVLNEIPIKLANENLKIEEEMSEKNKLKENLFILIPRPSILKIKKNKI